MNKVMSYKVDIEKCKAIKEKLDREGNKENLSLDDIVSQEATSIVKEKFKEREKSGRSNKDIIAMHYGLGDIVWIEPEENENEEELLKDIEEINEKGEEKNEEK